MYLHFPLVRQQTHLGPSFRREKHLDPSGLRVCVFMCICLCMCVSVCVTKNSRICEWWQWVGRGGAPLASATTMTTDGRRMKVVARREKSRDSLSASQWENNIIIIYKYNNRCICIKRFKNSVLPFFTWNNQTAAALCTLQLI